MRYALIAILGLCIACKSTLSPEEKSFNLAVSSFKKTSDIFTQSFDSPEVPLGKIKTHVKLELELLKYLKGIKLFVFSYDLGEPVLYEAVYINSSGDVGLLKHEFDPAATIIDDQVVNRINNFLAGEDYLSADHVVKLVEELFYLKHYRKDGLRILSSWEQIIIESPDSFPDNLKNKIKPMEISSDGNSVFLAFYTWDMFSAELYKCKVSYTGKKLRIEAVGLGAWGDRRIVI